MGERRVEQTVHLRRIGDIRHRRTERRPRRLERPESGLVDIADMDPGAGGQERLRRDAPDAGRGSRDDDALAFDIIAHGHALHFSGRLTLR